MKMPKIAMDKLEGDALRYARLITRQDGTLRASKPKVIKGDDESGCAAYVWRMVAFFVSPMRKHQCIPVLAEFDLPWQIRESRIRISKLNEITDRIIDAVPMADWHGVRRWGNAFGVIGEPILRENGTIVYR